MPFPSFQILGPRSRREALEPFGERLECSEGGSTGAGPSGPYRLNNCAQPAVRSAPNQDRRSARVIGGFGKNARQMPVPRPEARRKPSTVYSHTCPVQFKDHRQHRAGRRERFSLTEPPMRCLSARFLRQIEYWQLWRSLSYFGAGQPGRRDGQGPRVKFHPREANFRRG